MRQFVSTKIEKSIYDRAHVIAAYRQVSLADYLSDTLERSVDSDQEAMVLEMAESRARARAAKAGDGPGDPDDGPAGMAPPDGGSSGGHPHHPAARPPGKKSRSSPRADGTLPPGTLPPGPSGSAISPPVGPTARFAGSPPRPPRERPTPARKKGRREGGGLATGG